MFGRFAAGVLRRPVGAAARRGASSSAGRPMTVEKGSGLGPRMPKGNDPGNFHSEEFLEAENTKWRRLSYIASVPVIIWGIYNLVSPEPHHGPPPKYEYIQMKMKDPRFPWGEENLIGAPWHRHPEKYEDHH
mmetsp:Transcript_901/g.2474  ORF Transcript_901/g.2474 Transcript_901/m.2474 type:complete len:132 (-) Transcript_901:888-1283(-)